MFYDELEIFSRSTKHVILLGDFNARTDSLPNIAITDDEMLQQIGVSPKDYLVDFPPKLRKCFINFRLCTTLYQLKKGDGIILIVIYENVISV